MFSLDFFSFPKISSVCFLCVRVCLNVCLCTLCTHLLGFLVQTKRTLECLMPQRHTTPSHTFGLGLVPRQAEAPASGWNITLYSLVAILAISQETNQPPACLSGLLSPERGLISSAHQGAWDTNTVAGGEGEWLLVNCPVTIVH